MNARTAEVDSATGIGARIRRERERLGMTQSDFAAACNSGKRSQVGWEQGRTVPNAHVLAAWGEIGVDVNYVVTGTLPAYRLFDDALLHLSQAVDSLQQAAESPVRLRAPDLDAKFRAALDALVVLLADGAESP